MAIRRLLGLCLVAVALLTVHAPAAAPAVQYAGPEFVLSPEGNHLWAYDAKTNARQLLARAQNGEDPGAAAPNNLRRDINGQICVSPDQRFVVTGEDTVIPPAAPAPADGPGSHDPRIAGWGWFRISGDRLRDLRITQTGKLAPEAGAGPGYAGDPDNYGCGFLDHDRLFTTSLGNTLPGEPANGQLFLWFGPFENGFRQDTDAKTGNGFFVGEVAHCEIDRTLATAGGIAIDQGGDVLVASNRPTEIPGGEPSAVWRYSGRWPRSAAECTPDFLKANITKSPVFSTSLAGVPVNPFAPTPSAVVRSSNDTYFVSSVFSGTVSEFDRNGEFVRDVYPFSPVAPRRGPLGDTPFGMVITTDGSLWIADLGIVLATPAPGQGSLLRLRFDGDTPALAAETVADGLTFPDGLGVYRPIRLAALPGNVVMPSAAPPASALPATGGLAMVPLVFAALAVALSAFRRSIR